MYITERKDKQRAHAVFHSEILVAKTMDDSDVFALLLRAACAAR